MDVFDVILIVGLVGGFGGIGLGIFLYRKDKRG